MRRTSNLRTICGSRVQSGMLCRQAKSGWQRFGDRANGLAEAINVSPVAGFAFPFFVRVAVRGLFVCLHRTKFAFGLKPVLYLVTARPVTRNIDFVCPLANLIGRWLGL